MLIVLRYPRRWPVQLLASQHMDVQVVHTLTPMRPIVDDYSIPFLETLLSCYLRGYVQQVSNQKFVSFLHFCQLCKSVSLFGDHQEMRLCSRVDISERHGEVIFIQFVTRQLPSCYLIEYCHHLLIWPCRSLTIHFHLIIILKRRWRQCSNVRCVTIPTTATIGSPCPCLVVTPSANHVSM